MNLDTIKTFLASKLARYIGIGLVAALALFFAFKFWWLTLPAVLLFVAYTERANIKTLYEKIAGTPSA